MAEQKQKYRIVCADRTKTAMEFVETSNAEKLNRVVSRLNKTYPARKYSVEPVNSELSQRGDVSR